MKRITLILLLLLMLLPLCAKAVSYGDFIYDAADLFASYAGNKNTVCIMPLDGATEEFNSAFISDMSRELINRDCVVLDRQNTDAIVEELKFQTSGMVDDRTAVSIGHMMGAELLITGAATNSVSALSIEIKLIDVETTLVRRISKWEIKYDDVLRNTITGGASGVGTQKLSFGLRAGYMFAFSKPHEDMVGTGVNPVVKSQPLFMAAASVGYKVLDQLKIQTEINLSLNNNLNVSGMGVPETTVAYSTIEIPLLISFAAVRHPVIAEIYGGAYISIPVSDINIQMAGLGKGSIKLKGNTFGIMAGLSVSKSLGPGYIVADVRYVNDFDSLQIAGVFDTVYGTGEEAVPVTVDLTGMRVCTRRGVIASIGYSFAL